MISKHSVMSVGLQTAVTPKRSSFTCVVDTAIDDCVLRRSLSLQYSQNVIQRDLLYLISYYNCFGINESLHPLTLKTDSGVAVSSKTKI